MTNQSHKSEPNTLLIRPEDLTLAESALNANQLQLLLKRTPDKYVRKRPAKGGGEWDYVSIGYVQKALNIMFGFDWDFEIINQQVIGNEAIVQGRLTVRTNGRVITKSQFGNKDIVYKTEKVYDENGKPVMIQKGNQTVQKTRQTNDPLSIGNDLKAAASDCLKKCAAMVGIAADIYNKQEFMEVKVDTTELDWDALKADFSRIEDISADDAAAIEEIITTRDAKRYARARKAIDKYLNHK